MDANTLIKARATVLAAINMGIDPKTANKYPELEKAYLSALTTAGLAADAAQNVVNSEVANFSRGLLTGQFAEQLSDVDKLLINWKFIKAEELEALNEEISKMEAPAPAARAAREPAAPPQPKEIPFGISVGDKITIDGTSWRGFVATVTEIDPLTGWVKVTTEFPKGKEYVGKTRFSRITGLICKANEELPKDWWGKPGSYKEAPKPVQTELPAPAG